MKPNITYKSVIPKGLSLKKRNEFFHSLDKQSQRLEIAWDSLQLVLSGMKGTRGAYWDKALDPYKKNLQFVNSTELQI